MRHQQQGDRTRGLGLIDSETREALRRRRWRQPPLTRPALTVALVLVLVLHVLFALVLWYEMRAKPPRDTLAHNDHVLIVRLLGHDGMPNKAQPQAPPELPALEPLHKTVSPRPHRVTQAKPRPDAMVVQDHQAPPAPAASVTTPPDTHLFAKDGFVRLPPGATNSAPLAHAESKPAKPADDRRIMQHDSNRMHYKATRFEKYFPPPNETAGGAVGRHIGDAIKEIAKSVCDPKKPSTASNLLCGAPPLPPSSKNRDERLNLPPPPLADDLHPAKPIALSTCIAQYKAAKPLSYGCPVNTPDLAYKAEIRECIDLFRSGKRLKTWCPLDTPKRAAAQGQTPAASSRVESH